MSEPIAWKDIKAGDIIRRTDVEEFTAEDDDVPPRRISSTYELIERPVVLPTTEGHYLANGTELVTLHHNGQWLWSGDGSLSCVWTDDEMRGLRELTLLRPVAEVAAEVLDALAEMDDAETRSGTCAYTKRHIEKLSKHFGVTK